MSQKEYKHERPSFIPMQCSFSSEKTVSRMKKISENN